MEAWKRCISLAQSCSNMRQFKAIHALFIVNGLHLNNYAISKLISFCALSNSGSLSYASLIFSQIQNPNLFAYNTLIRAYSRSSTPQLALHYFQLMLDDENVGPDQHTFPFIISACTNSLWMLLGKQIHNWVLKNGVASSDRHVQTALVRFYAECCAMGDARKLFDEIPNLDVVQWNVLLNGYVRRGLAPEALNAFRNMLVSGVEPDEFCLTTALKGCAQLGALQQGKWIHEYVTKRKWLEADVFIGTALVDMYAKCGCIDRSVEVFEGMTKRNVFSWSAMIGGFALHGHVRKAMQCLERMQVEDGLRPDGVVLLGVIMACAHAGLQEEGQFLLENMEARYGILPKHEHYSCMVDLLCRAGQLDEALKLIRRMPMKPRAAVWGALLSGCRTHNNVDLAELAARELLMVGNGDGTEEDGAYVQLSNIYLAAQKCEDACRIRRMIGDKRIKTKPGCSLIEVEGEVNQFVSGDISHPCLAQIHEMLDLVSLQHSYKLAFHTTWSSCDEMELTFQP